MILDEIQLFIKDIEEILIKDKRFKDDIDFKRQVREIYRRKSKKELVYLPFPVGEPAVKEPCKPERIEVPVEKEKIVYRDVEKEKIVYRDIEKVVIKEVEVPTKEVKPPPEIKIVYVPVLPEEYELMDPSGTDGLEKAIHTYEDELGGINYKMKYEFLRNATLPQLKKFLNK
jgi:hypothetical protein